MSQPADPATLGFLGATDTVTGSRYLVERAGARVLIDCGLFQGYKRLRQRNWLEPGFEPASLDAVVLTHAHLDHSGYLPRLCQAGFAGPVYCTPGTRDLLQILLPDSGFLQEEEARHAAQFDSPPEPLYTRQRTDELKIHGRYVPVRAQIAQAYGLSAHADYRELGDWLEHSQLSPKRVFVTHGEPAASDALRRRLRDRFGWDVVVPDDRSTWVLG